MRGVKKKKPVYVWWRWWWGGRGHEVSAEIKKKARKPPHKQPRDGGESGCVWEEGCWWLPACSAVYVCRNKSGFILGTVGTKTVAVTCNKSGCQRARERAKRGGRKWG